MKNIYEKMFGKEPEIKAIHAGLECAIIGGKYPSLDMISFGPTIKYPHSPDEKVNIPSVKKFYDFLCKSLEEVPAVRLRLRLRLRVLSPEPCALCPPP